MGVICGRVPVPSGRAPVRARSGKVHGGAGAVPRSRAAEALPACGMRHAAGRSPGNLAGVRITEFWQRMNEQFGEVYAQSVAKDYVFAGLGDRTVQQALADGEDVKAIWRAICAAFPVPERLR
jgi:Protein of unknown function (DUF3046)